MPLLVQRFFTLITWAVATTLPTLVNRSGEKKGLSCFSFSFLILFLNKQITPRFAMGKSQFPYNALCFATLLLKVVKGGKEEKQDLSQIRK